MVFFTDFAELVRLDYVLYTHCTIFAQQQEYPHSRHFISTQYKDRRTATSHSIAIPLHTRHPPLTPLLSTLEDA